MLPEHSRQFTVLAESLTEHMLKNAAHRREFAEAYSATRARIGLPPVHTEDIMYARAVEIITEGMRRVDLLTSRDVAPDGTQKLHHRLISPVRVKDVTMPVSIELPGVAQRFASGHRIRLVIAAGDLAYANNTLAQPVTVTTSRLAPGKLELPLVGGLSF